ncbi:homing endonuclease [Vibrio phage D528]
MFLYKITNLVNGKYYIGVTEEPSRRFEDHLGGQGSKLVQHAAEKYGRDNIKFEVIGEGTTDEILEAEAELVTEELVNSRTIYNLVAGGGLPPKATSESSAKSAATRKKMVADGLLPKPPRPSAEAQLKGGATRKQMMADGDIPKPPRPSAEAQKRAGETRKRLHREGKIDIGPNRDHTIYTWQHKDGRVVEMKRSDMEAEYGLPSGNITNLLKGRSKTCLGWSIKNV